MVTRGTITSRTCATSLLLTVGCSSFSATINRVDDAGVTSGGTRSSSTATSATGGALPNIGGSTNSTSMLGTMGGAASVGGSTSEPSSTVGGNVPTGGSYATATGGVGLNPGGGTNGTSAPGSTGGAGHAGASTSAPSSIVGGNAPAGGSAVIPTTGGNTIANGGSTPVTSLSTGGSTGAGGTVSTGGMTTSVVSSGGTVATGGQSTTGGVATGGTSATGGASATGGTSAAGGTPTGGMSSTGGMTACSTNLESDSSNCGSCGHDCLGGACVSGRCSPAAMMTSGSAANWVNLFGLDDSNLYYQQAGGTAVGISSAWRISKEATDGTGTSLITGLAYATYHGPIGGTLFWTITPYMSSTTTGYLCDASNCVVPTSGWKSSIGFTFNYHSIVPTHYATLEPPSTATLIQWWDNSGFAIRDFPVTDAVNSPHSIMAAGDYYYWLGKNLDAQNNFVSASLYCVKYSTGGMAQLAGGMTASTEIVDANEQSVLLFDPGSGNLLRVPLPLGLGNNAPIALTNVGNERPSATEDSNFVYWIDSQGTMAKCSAANCAPTSVIVANAQNSASPLFQDSRALYWSHSGPDAIERLAK